MALDTTTEECFCNNEFKRVVEIAIIFVNLNVEVYIWFICELHLSRQKLPLQLSCCQSNRFKSRYMYYLLTVLYTTQLFICAVVRPRNYFSF